MAGYGDRSARLGNLSHEIVARDVVARIKAVKTEPHAREFLLEIGRERFAALVFGAGHAFMSDPLVKAG